MNTASGREREIAVARPSSFGCAIAMRVEAIPEFVPGKEHQGDPRRKRNG